MALTNYTERCREMFRQLFRRRRARALLQELLLEHLRGEYSINSIPELSVRMRCGPSDWKERGVYWDTEMGIVLYARQKGRKRKQVALIGFRPIWDVLVVEQLQGLGRRKMVFRAVRWEQLLVRLLVCLAKETRWYSEVRMVTASRLYYYSKPIGKKFRRRKHALAEHKRRLRTRYDGTARALGFRWNREKNIWIYNLQTG